MTTSVTTSVPSSVPLLTMNEFSAGLRSLVEREQVQCLLQHITVPMVNFVYLCSDLYFQVRAVYHQILPVSPLNQVFLVLDLVCSADDFASADDRESTACACFALYNNVSVLQYLWRAGFNWDEMTLLNAVKANSTDCLRFALENGCPLNTLTYKQLVTFVSMYGSKEMRHFFVKKQ